MAYDEDEITIIIGSFTFTSFFGYVCDITRDSITFQACNGVESGIDIVIDGYVVSICISGDWGNNC